MSTGAALVYRPLLPELRPWSLSTTSPRRQRRRRGLGSRHHAVLALLSAKPAHGYDLKSSFEQAVGDQWGGLNIAWVPRGGRDQSMGFVRCHR